MCLWSGQGHDWFVASLPQDKDIYLLDDPLAAVDTDVANHLMQKCIVELLRGKTRILCTHRVEFVDKADVVILMDNGTIVRTGQEKNQTSMCLQLQPTSPRSKPVVVFHQQGRQQKSFL